MMNDAQHSPTNLQHFNFFLCLIVKLKCFIMKKKNPVVHFEMPANDRKRMAAFYSQAFGWETQMLGEDMGNYVTVYTTDVDENRMPMRAGAINGGFYPKQAGTVEQHPSIVIAVDDIYESINTIQEAGGQVLGEPVQIPRIGKYVSFIDTEGNRCSILQPLMI
jgi:predicted enzyme related to lactoylglutathione lyase